MSNPDPYLGVTLPELDEQRHSDEATRRRAPADRWIRNLRWLMSGPKGREIVKMLIDWPGSRKSFTPNGLVLANDAGRRELSEKLDRDARRLFPKEWIEMHKEHEDASTG